MEELKALLRERDQLDGQIEMERAVLKANDSTMESPLVDAEGFPLASIDVYAVRHARVKIIEMLNDRSDLEKKIVTAMEEAHEKARALKEKTDGKEEPVIPATTASEPVPTVHRTSNLPFCHVKSVVPGGPAFQGGLREDDLVLQWGSIHLGSFTNIQQIAELTGNSINKVIRVTVIRNAHPVRLEIRPHKWDGSGVLGCQLESMEHKKEREQEASSDG